MMDTPRRIHTVSAGYLRCFAKKRAGDVPQHPPRHARQRSEGHQILGGLPRGARAGSGTAELADLLPTVGDDERELAGFLTHDFEPRLRLIDGGAKA